jgi:uncharacterized protein (DUF2336 family)
MTSAELTFIREVEKAVSGASLDRRGEMVRKITDLFVSRSDELSAEDLTIFDDVIMRFASEIEQAARALLSRRLAPIRNAPPQIIRVLAFDDSIEVAGPVLTQSTRLDDRTLIENARTKSQAHLLAISQRGSLSEVVTDVLVELGDREVVLNLADNFGASISDRGFSLLVGRSEGDDLLSEFVGSRPEIPASLLTALVAKASESVRAKLEASHPLAKAAVQRAVAEAANRVETQAVLGKLDYTAALKTIADLRQTGQLNERALSNFARNGAYAETIAMLATMCNLPLPFVEQVMGRDRSEALMVLARAIGLSWSTAQDILLLRADKGVIARSEIVHRLSRYERLQPSAAQEIVRVFRSRAQVKAPAAVAR